VTITERSLQSGASPASSVDAATGSSRYRRLARRPAFAPVVVGVLGYLISGLGNWIPSVWFDEAATVTSATRSWAALFAETQHVDLVHAAYYSFMHLVFDAFGYSPFTLRLPSAIAVGLTAALLVVLVREFGQQRLAVVSAVVYILIPRVVWAGGEGRSFAISALLAVAVSLVLAWALRTGRRRWWVVYTAITMLSVLVFAYLALVILAHIVMIIAESRRDSRHRPAARWLLSMALIGALLLPFVVALHGQTQQISWIDGISVATFQQVFVTQWFWGTIALPVVAWLLMIAGGVALLRRGPVIGASSRRRLGLIVVPAIVIPTLALLAETAVSTPMYSPRYVSMSAPFVAVAMGAGLLALEARLSTGLVRWGRIANGRSSIPGRWVVVVGILVIAALSIPHLVTVSRAPAAKQDSTWGAVASLIGSERAGQPADSVTAIVYGPVRYHASATTRVIEVAYPEPFEGTVDVTLDTPADERAQLWESHLPLADTESRLADADVTYLITSIKQNQVPSTTATMNSLGWHAAHTWTLGDVRVVRYDR
jgi:mannosyltransferase